MSWVVVISRKVARPACRLGYAESYQFAEYLNQLTKAANQKAGFISSNSFWSNHRSCERYNTAISVSKWTSEKHWEDWLKSRTRAEIYCEHKDMIESEKFEVLIKKKDTNTVPLL